MAGILTRGSLTPKPGLCQPGSITASQMYLMPRSRNRGPERQGGLLLATLLPSGRARIRTQFCFPAMPEVLRRPALAVWQFPLTVLRD